MFSFFVHLQYDFFLCFYMHIENMQIFIFGKEYLKLPILYLIVAVFNIFSKKKNISYSILSFPFLFNTTFCRSLF